MKLLRPRTWIRIASILFFFCFAYANAEQFVDKKESSCDLRLAIYKKGFENKCLESFAQNIKNLADRQVFLSWLEAWNPPRGLKVSSNGPVVSISIDHKLVARGAWISIDPAILYWNGKILVQTKDSNSISEKLEDLFAQYDKQTKTSTLFDLILPKAQAGLAWAQAEPSRALFYFVSLDPNWRSTYANRSVESRQLLSALQAMTLTVQEAPLVASSKVACPGSKIILNQSFRSSYSSDTGSSSTNFTFESVDGQPNRVILKGYAKPILLEYESFPSKGQKDDIIKTETPSVFICDKEDCSSSHPIDLLNVYYDLYKPVNPTASNADFNTTETDIQKSLNEIVLGVDNSDRSHGSLASMVVILNECRKVQKCWVEAEKMGVCSGAPPKVPAEQTPNTK